MTRRQQITKWNKKGVRTIVIGILYKNNRQTNSCETWQMDGTWGIRSQTKLGVCVDVRNQDEIVRLGMREGAAIIANRSVNISKFD